MAFELQLKDQRRFLNKDWWTSIQPIASQNNYIPEHLNPKIFLQHLHPAAGSQWLSKSATTKWLVTNRKQRKKKGKTTSIRDAQIAFN